MNTWVEAPPRRKGLGCFGRGCLIVLVFAIVLAIACFAGMYWGLHRHSALFYGSYWLAKTRSLAEAPTTVPEFSGSDQQIQRAREGWQDFEQKTRAGQPAEIELSADDINALIATSEDVRRKVFASIDGKTELSEREVSEANLDTCFPLRKTARSFKQFCIARFTPDCIFVLNGAFYGRFLCRITSSAAKYSGDIQA